MTPPRYTPSDLSAKKARRASNAVKRDLSWAPKGYYCEVSMNGLYSVARALVRGKESWSAWYRPGWGLREDGHALPIGPHVATADEAKAMCQAHWKTDKPQSLVRRSKLSR